MLTPSVLPNLPLDHPAKKTGSASNVAGAFDLEDARFCKLLAREMGNKPDMSRTKQADKNTGTQEAGEKTKSATERPERAGTPNESEDASLEEARKSEPAPTSASQQIIDAVGMLPASTTGQQVHIPVEVSSAARAHGHAEHQPDSSVIDIQGYGATDGLGRGVPGRNTTISSHSSADVSQAEEEGAVTGYAMLAGQFPGLIHGNVAPDAAGARPGPAVIQRSGSQMRGLSPDIPADIAANLSAGAVPGVRDEATRTGSYTGLQNLAAAQLDMDARHDGSSHSELGLKDSPFGSELTTTVHSSAGTVESVPQNLSAVGAEAALSAFAIERGLAPISAATAGLLDHFLPRVEPRLGSAGWDNALGQKIIWMVSQQQQTAELSLNPPDLGPLQIVLSINNDQASAMFVSNNADVRQTLEAALPRLKEMMADSGISLGSTTVSSDSSQQGVLAEGFERRNHSRARYADGDPQNVSDSDRAGTARISVNSLAGLVDTFA